MRGHKIKKTIVKCDFFVPKCKNLKKTKFSDYVKLLLKKIVSEKNSELEFFFLISLVTILYAASQKLQFLAERGAQNRKR